jgi:type III secretion system YscI/HrpB-like protein
MRIISSTESVAPYVPEGPVRGEEAPAAGRPADPTSFTRLLEGLGRELHSGEVLAERAIRGGSGSSGMSPEALLALQAGIYRYSEAVDLVTKLVDRAAQSVKTTLQNQ